MDIKEPNVQKIELEILPQSLYIKGRYFKNARNLPQTKWHCRHCWGRGHTRNGEECEECGGTGRTYPSSIEDKFEKVFLKYTDGTRGVLHAAGREDVDARCLGNGRPFLMEIKKPKKRYINLPKIEREINKENDGKVMAIGLKFGKKQYIVNLKKRSNIDRKKYQALVFLNKTIDKSYFQKKMEKAKNKIVGSEIHQRTPLRVVHRRVDKVRNKRIYDLKGKFIDPVHVSFIIETQGGTYIKEFISGDKYRTKPSLSELFGIKMKCVELDVIYIL